MSCILHIESSTKVCSLALSLDGEVVFNRIQVENASHAAELGRYAWDAMEYVREHKLQPHAVAISAGPGSYTGLRIGLSEAKGLCYGMNIPLIAVSSLKVMCNGLLESALHYKSENHFLFCPMIDARRMEVYSAIYDKNMDEISSVQADIIDENSYEEYLHNQSVIFFGDGSDKCKSVILSPNALFVDGIYPMASAMVSLAEKAYAEQDFVDIAYFEPFYLKEFQATVAKNKVIPPADSFKK